MHADYYIVTATTITFFQIYIMYKTSKVPSQSYHIEVHCTKYSFTITNFKDYFLNFYFLYASLYVYVSLFNLQFKGRNQIRGLKFFTVIGRKKRRKENICCENIDQKTSKWIGLTLKEFDFLLQCTVMLWIAIKKLPLFSLKSAWEGGVNEYKPQRG